MFMAHPIQSSSSHFLSEPNSPRPGRGILAEIEVFVENFNANTLSFEQGKEGFESMIEKLMVTLKGNDLSLGRLGFIKLLEIKEKKFQAVASHFLTTLFNAQTLSYDIAHKQAQQLVDIDETIGRVVEQIIMLGVSSSEGLSMPLVRCFFHLYRGLLEHLWLLPYLDEDRSTYSIIVEQNGGSIVNRVNRWLDLLSNHLDETAPEMECVLTVRKRVQRLTDPPSTIVGEMIEQAKQFLDHPFLQTFLGHVYFEAEDQSGAIYCYTEALKTIIPYKPTTENQQRILKELAGRVYGNLGAIYIIQHKYQEAISHLQSAQSYIKDTELQEIQFWIYEKLGDAYWGLKAYEVALENYEKALKSTESIVDRRRLYQKLGDRWFFMKEFSKAIEFYKEALLLKGEVEDQSLEFELCECLGNSHRLLKEYDQAVVWFEKALQLEEASPPKQKRWALCYHLGLIYHDFHKYEKAISCYQNAIVLDIEDKEAICAAKMSMANSYQYLGDNQSAITFYKQALEVSTDLTDRSKIATIYGNLGNSYIDIGEYSEAR